MLPALISSEVNYYRKKTGYTIDESEAWSEFKKLDGVFTQVSKEQLRLEASKVIDEVGIYRIFVDRDAKTVWISGLGPDPQERYVYWWTS